MPIIAVVGLKGGSGKSLTTVALAGAFWRRDHRVIVVDGDPTETATRWSEASDHAVRVEPFEGALTRPDQLFGFVEERRALALVDTAPNARERQWVALMAADLALVPVTPGAFVDDAMADTLDLVEDAVSIRPWLRVGVFVTRAPRRGDTVSTPGRSVPPAWRLDCALSDRPQYRRAIEEGRTVADVAPRSIAAHEVARLVERVEARLPMRRMRTLVGRLDLNDPAVFDLPKLPSAPPSPVPRRPGGDGWAEPTVYGVDET